MDAKIKNRVSFTTEQKIKYFSINLTKQVQNLYVENDTVLTKEIRGWLGGSVG